MADDVTLTPREFDILLGCAEGQRYTQVAVSLGISYGTVVANVEHIRMKLGAKTITHAVALAYHHGILKAP